MEESESAGNGALIVDEDWPEMPAREETPFEIERRFLIEEITKVGPSGVGISVHLSDSH